MIKKLLLLSLIILINPNFTKADLQYIEEYTTKTEFPGISGMPNINNTGNIPPQYKNIMNNMLQNTPDIKTFYIKGSKKRVDDHKTNISTIINCLNQKIITVDHGYKTYSTSNMNMYINQIQSWCNQGNIINQQTFSTEIPKQPYINPNQQQGQLTIRTSIRDTGQTELIGTLLAKHYIKEYEISGNPNCIPDMKNVEHIWAINFQPDRFQCPVINNFKACKDKMPPPRPNMPYNQNNCFKNAKYVKEGLNIIPGFEVKKIVELDMSAMIPGRTGNMPAMPQGIPPMMPGNMKSINITEIKNISNQPLPETLFEAPQGYTEVNNGGYNPNNFDFSFYTDVSSMKYKGG
ncbi:MAG: hypothetical protein AB1782_10230 [Cyanobacteriota bacterium]